MPPSENHLHADPAPKTWERFLPFLAWRHEITPQTLVPDLLAGLTVALILIPHAMAVAQLAGLPAYYGLYAGFLPAAVGALFGSSRHLNTGPVALVSLMTAAALTPIAAAGTQGYIAYAIMLALLVGLFQLSLGVLRLGVLVNFLSHSVIAGFMAAAALIIATSQLRHLFGVQVDRYEYQYQTVAAVIRAALDYTHVPTLLIGLLALVIIFALKKVHPRIPAVLVAVIITGIIAWAIGLENERRVPVEAIQDPQVRGTILEFVQVIEERDMALALWQQSLEEARIAQSANGRDSRAFVQEAQQAALLELEVDSLEAHARALRRSLWRVRLNATEQDGRLLLDTPARTESPEPTWRLIIGSGDFDPQRLLVRAGGAVVGTVPRGLPHFSAPTFDLGVALRLLPSVVIIALIGFMEAISIAKAMAATTGQRIDPNQELIGQGLANITGSFFQSYPVSGSFARSAVNIGAGAKTGLASIFLCAFVGIALLCLAPLIYYIPKSVLAAVVIGAVFRLATPKPIFQAWKVRRSDGLVATVTFCLTLVFAPHLDKGIFVGVILALCLYLYRRMFPPITILSRHQDGTLRDSHRFHLQQCRHILVIRFDGSLFFANSAYFEERLLEEVRSRPELTHIIFDGSAMNDLDATGIDMLGRQMGRLRLADYKVYFAGFHSLVAEIMERSGFLRRIGPEFFFRTVEEALAKVHPPAHAGSEETVCPLLKPLPENGEPGRPTPQPASSP